jgi:tetraacyldisaccharide 4'-kinase
MMARRVWAWPLAPIYAAALMARDGLRRLGWMRVRRLAWPVISVGSLSAGGAGKTPVVIALAELLRTRGWHVDVLSRGYGRDSSDANLKDFAAQVVPDLDDAASRFGDEPTLIARKTGVPVWVSTNRFFAGKSAEDFATEDVWNFVSETEVEVSAAAPVRGIHLLDDGFQHWGLARAVDVVLVTEEDLEDALLPAGNRRERLAALRRADVVVLREVELERVEARVRRLMRAGAAVWSVRRELRFAELEGLASAGARPLVFCAIARPEGFWAMLKDAGCQLAEIVAFGDHHAYAMVDMVRMVAMAKKCGATGFITTEKDAVKLTDAMMERLREVGPVCVAGLTARFVDEADVVREMEERLR